MNIETIKSDALEEGLKARIIELFTQIRYYGDIDKAIKSKVDPAVQKIRTALSEIELIRKELDEMAAAQKKAQ